MVHVARTFVIRGRVQGVGYRYFAQKAGLALGLKGWVKNLRDGRVECMAVGTASQLEQLEAKLRQGPMLAHVEEVWATDSQAPDGMQGFEIR